MSLCFFQFKAGGLVVGVALVATGLARGQAFDRLDVSSISGPALDLNSHSAPIADDDARLAECLAEGPEPPGPAVELGPTGPSRGAGGPLDVVRESIIGPASAADWRPLGLATFFTEGWNKAYVKSPNGENEAPKQNWLGTKDGIFARLGSLSFFYTNGLTNSTGLLLVPVPWSPAKPQANGAGYLGVFSLYVPLNQRMEVLIVAPFIAANKTAPHGRYVGNFGDLTIEARFRLVERRNFTLLTSLAERAPTGKTVNGNDINFVSPGLQFWWNFAPKWVARGGTGINIDTGRQSATNVYFNNLAIGRYLTTKDAQIFKELVVYASASVLADVAGRKGFVSDVYITPGIRFGLDDDRKWYAMGAVQVPVSGPRPYDWQALFALARNY